MKDFNEFEKELIMNLKASGLIEKYSTYEFKQDPNLNEIIKLFEEPSLIYSDEFGLYYEDDNGDKNYCPEMLVTISEKGEWLSDKIPNINFDIDQNGNVRKADEVEALYCGIVVANILKDKIFKSEIEEIAKSYDFDSMKSFEKGGRTFRGMLNDWQELQSISINIIISACRYRISDYKKDIEKFLKDGISDMEAAELRDLDAKIRAVNFEYSEGVLSPVEVKKLTKIQRLSIIDERDNKISNFIANSKAGTLYKLLNLSTEYISPIKKKKIQLWVNKEVDKLLKIDQFKNFVEDRSQLASKLSRRALKFSKLSNRRIFIEKYIQDRENFKFPAKQ